MSDDSIKWTLDKIQNLIKNNIEESNQIEYKSSGALGKTPGKRNEITKDISSFANANGGVVIYGIKEYDDKDMEHLPEKIDPINRVEFNKEWLDQVIGNIEPRIDDLKIIPIDIDSSINGVVYVVIIPQSHTAHQASSHKYYRRYNFESVPMRDYEIRDVMNRAVSPKADLVITHNLGNYSPEEHNYKLEILINNTGQISIQNFKVKITIPYFGKEISHNKIGRDQYSNIGFISAGRNSQRDYQFSFSSSLVLFPEDTFDLGSFINIRYMIDDKAYNEITKLESDNRGYLLWNLYADNMKPQKGSILLSHLNDY